MDMDIYVRENYRPKHLVLGPGGNKGFYMLGALHELEYRQCLSQVESYIGVSVGSIIALLLCCGYTVTEILSIASSFNIMVDWIQYMTEEYTIPLYSPPGVVHSNPVNTHTTRINVRDRLMEMKSNMGIFSENILGGKLESLIVQKIGFNPTLSQLYQLRSKKFGVVSFNATQSKVEYITMETMPDMKCTTAVIMSCAIPFLFYKVVYHGNIYADGSIVDPLPLQLVDNGVDEVLAVYMKRTEGNVDIENFTDVVHYINCLVEAPMGRIRDLRIQYASPKCRIISIPCNYNGLTIGSIAGLKQGEMFNEGSTEAKLFLYNVGVSMSSIGESSSSSSSSSSVGSSSNVTTDVVEESSPSSSNEESSTSSSIGESSTSSSRSVTIETIDEDSEDMTEEYNKRAEGITAIVNIVSLLKP